MTYKSDTGFLRSSLFTVSILGVVLRSLPPQKYINILYCDTSGSCFYIYTCAAAGVHCAAWGPGAGADVLSEPPELAPLPVPASLGLHDGVSGRVLWAMRVVVTVERTVGTGRYGLLVGSWLWLPSRLPIPPS